MATLSPNDLELALKKRARRRLVGAIALVLFMVIVLPMVLQDRASLTQQESIKITMPDDISQQEPKSVANTSVVDSQSKIAAVNEPESSEPVKSESLIANAPELKEIRNEKNLSLDEKKTEEKPVNKAEVIVSQVKKPEVKSIEPKEPEIKKPETKVPDLKSAAPNGESFTIQVGVYSDLANVKQLQTRLKQIGLDSHTENISTPKGEKIRLRAGRFNSRQEAAQALTRLQAAYLTGMVISNN